MAPEVGLEPTTYRLTADRSAIELLGKIELLQVTTRNIVPDRTERVKMVVARIEKEDRDGLSPGRERELLVEFGAESY